ncbi:hypothetical protein GCM10010371_01460 [Streptomyces subrutilus]|uniref:Uncharacterized protein n=1 Tax=Streptomyces subrutilus TaxID=36818 RepID=A0A5P2UFP8_9ACTN|nr:hypothetical protein [Streptomyces subrutilus]QEU77275.1 hypothetical protein CP968_02285 [Streptomyces subrutilus]GGZ46095.1 hypothetical protein GCM10010371_01460 [Streptomyces subrutilus]
MNDPITLAATDTEARHGFPDSPVPAVLEPVTPVAVAPPTAAAPAPVAPVADTPVRADPLPDAAVRADPLPEAPPPAGPIAAAPAAPAPVVSAPAASAPLVSAAAAPAPAPVAPAPAAPAPAEPAAVPAGADPQAPVAGAPVPDAPDPEAPVPDGPGAATIRTLVDAVATCRPLEEVTALVSILKDNGQPDPGYEALRTAAVTRPVDEVRQMLALLGEPPHEVDEADVTLQAAAVGRSIEDVARLVTILGTDGPAAPDAHPAGPAPRPARDAQARAPRHREPSEAPPAKEPHPRAAPVPHAASAPRAPGSSALRHVLRWPVAIALLVTGALHLPADLTVPPSASPAELLPIVVTVLCLGAGVLLAVRDTPTVWRVGALTALGVVALHVVGGVAHYDPLASALGGTLAWAGIVTVMCAAAGAVLAGLALRNRQEDPA